MIALYLSLIDEELQKKKFEKVYYRYRNLMYYIAFQVLNNERDSEDSVQELLRIWTKSVMWKVMRQKILWR